MSWHGTDTEMHMGWVANKIGPLVATALLANHDSNNNVHPLRREFITTSIIGCTTVGCGWTTGTTAITDDDEAVTLPLEYCKGGVSCVRLTVYEGQQQQQIDDHLPSAPPRYRIYRVIVDTGSPYLVLSSSKQDIIFSTEEEEPWYNKKNSDNLFFRFSDSEYSPTSEIYGSQLGKIDWKRVSISFRFQSKTQPVVLGLMDNVLTEESGGSLLGLIRYNNPKPSSKVEKRPTFLEQQSILQNNHDNKKTISSFRLDYPNKKLTLSSTNNLILQTNKNNRFPLIDLRKYGDFVDHYACVVKEIIIPTKNNNNVSINSRMLQPKKGTRPLVAVFDTGLTGCLFIKSLWDRLVELNINPAEWDSLQLDIPTTKTKNIQTISSSKSTNPFFYIAPISLDWFDDETTEPFVIVLGQTFLSQGALTIDMDYRIATFEIGDRKNN